MSYSSITTARDDVTAAMDTATSALTASVDVLRKVAATDQDLGAAASAMTSACVAIRAIRTDLDGTDAEALQHFEDAAVTLTLWGWDREVRRNLSRMEGQLQASLGLVDQLRAGIAQGYVTVGSGDTMQSLAARYLGGWQEWPRLAAANGLPAGPVAVGTTLILPQKV